MKTSETKMHIVKDWLGALPQLTAYSQSKLLKIVGPTLMGIELLRLPRMNKYRPCFIVFPLWKQTEKECIDEPSMLEEILNSKGLQFNIPYHDHERFFASAISCMKEQIDVSLDKDVSIDGFLQMVGRQFSRTLIRASPVQQAKLFELGFHSALYVNDPDLLTQLSHSIESTGKNWPKDLFNWKFGTFDDWLHNLLRKRSTRETFIDQVEKNRGLERFKRLRFSELKK